VDAAFMLFDFGAVGPWRHLRAAHEAQEALQPLWHHPGWESYDMVAPAMLLELHERGIHAV
jgi:hypothetical protein